MDNRHVTELVKVTQSIEIVRLLHYLCMTVIFMIALLTTSNGVVFITVFLGLFHSVFDITKAILMEDKMKLLYSTIILQISVSILSLIRLYDLYSTTNVPNEYKAIVYYSLGILLFYRVSFPLVEPPKLSVDYIANFYEMISIPHLCVIIMTFTINGSAMQAILCWAIIISAMVTLYHMVLIKEMNLSHVTYVTMITFNIISVLVLPLDPPYHRWVVLTKGIEWLFILPIVLYKIIQVFRTM